MGAVDRVRRLPDISVPNTAANGVRFRSQGENNKRTERYNLRVTGQVDITVAGAAVLNRGSILAALTDLGFTDGGTDKVVLDARLARFVAEAMAPSALPATRLAGAGVQAATQLAETCPLWLASPRSLNPDETKYVETNKQLTQEVFVTPFRDVTRLAQGATGTITNLNVTVEQVYDDLLAVPPLLTVYTRQLAQDVAGANTRFKIDLRGSRFVRGIAIQQDTDNRGEVSDIINSLILRGDAGSVFGDASIPYRDLVEHSQEEYGGAVVAAPGYLFIDFQRYGRLGTFWAPYQDTNLRLELDVQPSAVAGATGSKVRVAMWEYERTGATAKEIPFGI